MDLHLTMECSPGRHLVCALLLATALAVGCDADDIERLTPAQTKQHLDNKEATVLDVRGASAYQASHIAGSVELSVFDTGSAARDRLIITYCS